MQPLERFQLRIREEWLPDYCNAPHRRYDPGGFRQASVKVAPVDAEDCMYALDNGVVSRAGPGEFRAARSSAKELLFWEGRRSTTPRTITLWLEPVITFAALGRLHRDYRWPIDQLGCQSKGWGFDLVGFDASAADGPCLLGEVKKTPKELETLRSDLLALSQGSDPKVVSTNSLKKWTELSASSATLLWLIGPDGAGHSYGIARKPTQVQLEAVDLSSLVYRGGA